MNLRLAIRNIGKRTTLTSAPTLFYKQSGPLRAVSGYSIRPFPDMLPKLDRNILLRIANLSARVIIYPLLPTRSWPSAPMDNVDESGDAQLAISRQDSIRCMEPLPLTGEQIKRAQLVSSGRKSNFPAAETTDYSISWPRMDTIVLPDAAHRRRA